MYGLDRRHFLKRIGIAGASSLIALPGSRLLLAAPQSTDETALAKRLETINAAHPRLHFDAEGRERLRERSRTTHERYTRLLVDWVESHRDWSLPVDLPDRSLNEVVLEENAAFLTNAALAFVVTGNERHLEIARRWALAMCRRPQGEVRNYGLGIYAAGLARAYDWLYEHWTDREREQLRRHLAFLVRQVYLGSIPGSGKTQWWADAHLHHDHWVPVGGFGEAALALLGEVDEASRWAARARLDFDVVLSWLGDDGAWLEGPADWCYALAPLLWFYGAWQGVVGEDLHNVPWLRSTALYRLYHRLPDDTYVYLNDSFRSGRYNTSGNASCHLLRRLASIFRDGRAQWLAERDEAFDLKPGPKGVYRAPYEGSSYRAERIEYEEAASQCMAWNLIWYDPSVRALPPNDLPTCRHFTNQGVAILRSGWDEQASVVSFSSGPLGGHRAAARIRAGERRSTANFSHAHVDYNSVTLFARGRYVLVPPGYARRGSRFQNTVTVNGGDFRPDPALDIRLEALVDGSGFCYAVGNATAGFPLGARVDRYRRHLVLLAGALVIFDELSTSDTSRRPWNWFYWTLHSDPRVHELAVTGNVATWRPPGEDQPSLLLYVLEPEGFAWERAKLDATGGTSMLEALRIVRPERYSRTMRVLAVLSWDASASRPAMVRHERLVGVGWPEERDRPAVTFATRPLAERDARELDLPELKNRAWLLFNLDPMRPESYVRR